MDDASVVDLCSALRCSGEDELSVREYRLESSSIWELSIEKRRSERLGIRPAAVKNNDGLFVRTGGQDDKGFWVLGRATFLRAFRGRHFFGNKASYGQFDLVVLVYRVNNRWVKDS